MSMKSYIKLNKEITVSGKPKGWVVREYVNKNTNKTVLLDFGIYVTEDYFLSVPISYNMKSKLIRANIDDPVYNFYFLPSDLEFGITTFVSKSKKRLPLLVEPDDVHPPVLLTFVAVTPEVGNDVILDAHFNNDKMVAVKDYIDKGRKSLAMIIANTDTSVINPSIDFDVTIGALGAKVNEVRSYHFAEESFAIKSDTNVWSDDHVNETQFISIPRFIKNTHRKPTNDSSKSTANNSTTVTEN